jgi:hypothetical protein
MCATAYFAPQIALALRFFAVFSAFTSDPAAVFANRGEKTPDLPSRAKPPGIPLPQRICPKI